MTGQRELAVQIAEQSRASVLALLAALDDEQEFVDLAALAIGAASARAWTLADLGLASTLGALPLGLIAPDERDRVSAALLGLLQLDAPEARVARLARAEPLTSWRSAMGEAMQRRNVRGWTRRTSSAPCPLCTRLANGAVLPPDARMIEHPGCSCIQAVVVQ